MAKMKKHTITDGILTKLLGIFWANALNAQAPVFSANVDLNADNTVETVKVKSTSKP